MNCPAECVTLLQGVCAPPAPVSCLLPSLGTAIGWALVIIGWAVVSHGHNKRERRKEIRAEIVTLVTRIRELEQQAHDYFTTSVNAQSFANALRIKSGLQHLALALNRLSQHEAILDVRDQLIEFRQEVTKGDFESEARIPLPPHDARFVEITHAACGLVNALEAAFRRRYSI